MPFLAEPSQKPTRFDPMRFADIYFLSTALPNLPEMHGHEWTLRNVRVSASVPLAYLAFESMVLARLVRGGRTHITLLPSSRLGARHYYNFGAYPIIYFESDAAVLEWLGNRATFDYSPYLRRFYSDTGVRPFSAVP